MNKKEKSTQYNSQDLCYTTIAGESPAMLFDNLPEILRPNTAAELLGISVKTIYDWRYRQETRNIPKNLFIKINRFLYIRTSALRDWIGQQNNTLL